METARRLGADRSDSILAVIRRVPFVCGPAAIIPVHRKIVRPLPDTTGSPGFAIANIAVGLHRCVVHHVANVLRGNSAKAFSASS